MSNMNMMVQGNLALKFDEPARAEAPARPTFTVIEGARRYDLERPRSARTASTVNTAPVSKAMISLFISAACVALAIICSIFAARTTAYADIAQQTPLETVHVAEGDTIWSLAEHHPVDGLSTYETVKLIESQNSLSSSALAAGQDILVPVSSNSR